MELTKLGTVVNNINYKVIGDYINSEDMKEVIESTYNSTLTGSQYRLYLTENENLCLYGPMDRNSMTMAEYEGKAIRLATLPAHREIPYYTSDTIYDELTFYQQTQFLALLNDEFSSLYPDEDLTEYGFYDYASLDDDKVYDLLTDNFKEVKKQLEYELIMNDIDDIVDNLCDEAYDTLEDYRDRLRDYDKEYDIEF